MSLPLPLAFMVSGCTMVNFLGCTNLELLFTIEPTRRIFQRRWQLQILETINISNSIVDQLFE